MESTWLHDIKQDRVEKRKRGMITLPRFVTLPYVAHDLQDDEEDDEDQGSDHYLLR